MRKSLGNLSGSLLVNGQPAHASFIRQTSYVPQVSPAQQRHPLRQLQPPSSLPTWSCLFSDATGRYGQGSTIPSPVELV